MAKSFGQNRPSKPLKSHEELGATPEPVAQPVVWTLIAPDGRTWQGATPVAAIRAEQNSRIPATVQMNNIMNALWEATEPTDDQAARFCELVNWMPDGFQNRFIAGQQHSITFRELAKGYITAAMLATTEPKP